MCKVAGGRCIALSVVNDCSLGQKVGADGEEAALLLAASQEAFLPVLANKLQRLHRSVSVKQRDHQRIFVLPQSMRGNALPLKIGMDIALHRLVPHRLRLLGDNALLDLLS